MLVRDYCAAISNGKDYAVMFHILIDDEAYFCAECSEPLQVDDSARCRMCEEEFCLNCYRAHRDECKAALDCLSQMEE